MRLTINDDSTHFSASFLSKQATLYELHIIQVMSFSEINWKMVEKRMNEWKERQRHHCGVSPVCM